MSFSLGVLFCFSIFFLFVKMSNICLRINQLLKEFWTPR
jgi:hypothetical protein